MKKTIKLTIAISTILLLNNCGGGTSVDGGIQQIPVTNCNIYTPIQSGDTLVKEVDGTVVKIVELGDGSKEVCVDTTVFANGAAHLLR